MTILPLIEPYFLFNSGNIQISLGLQGASSILSWGTGEWTV